MSEENKSPENDEAVEAAAAEDLGEGANPEAAQASVEEMQLMLEDARNKADEHWNQLLRQKAEMENAARRAEREVDNARKYALERFVGELLPVKDSLEMGLAAASGDDEMVAKLREGTELTLKMFTAVLEKFGVKEVHPVGEPFNPELHQAMSMQESADQAPNTVLAVMQKGYTLNERLVRPAMVVVAKAASGSVGIDEQA